MRLLFLLPLLEQTYGICSVQIVGYRMPLNPKEKHTKKIIGGTEYDPHKYPWLAALVYNESFFCGGSIITELYVISAAHCLTNRYDQDLLKVSVGEHNRCKSNTKTTLFSVNKIIRHKRFDRETYFADIMLLKLSMSISFNRYVQPICLPKFDITLDTVSRYSGKPAHVIGWGKKKSDITTPTCLPQELQVPILDRKLCTKYLRNSLFCAGYLEGGADSCQGDSGGPLMLLTKRNKYELIGIVSNGIGCGLAGHPGLYTDVLRFLPWVWRQTDGSVYCI